MGKPPKMVRAIRRETHIREERVATRTVRTTCNLALEGVVSKQRDPNHRPGRVDFRPKTKTKFVELFAVVGADPEFGTARSLRLARLMDPGALVPCGWVASGLSERGGRRIRAALDTGRPILAEVEFGGFTSAGEPRHPVIKRWHAG
jgi:bifunctional non-homologous end joining protein LigD